MRSDGPKRNASTAVAGLLPTRLWKGLLRQQAVEDLAMPRSGSLRPVGEALAPLIEGPDPGDGGDPRREGVGWGQWIKGQLSRAPSVSAASASCPRSDLRLLLGVMGAPLAPIHVCSTNPLPHLSIKGTPIVGVPGWHAYRAMPSTLGSCQPRPEMCHIRLDPWIRFFKTDTVFFTELWYCSYRTVSDMTQLVPC